MNVLSLFDGISCGQLALQRAGIKYDNYFASEIDKHAIKVAKTNFPNTIHIGDVTKVKAIDLPKIDLIIGGSPCQGFSFAGKGLNFNDPRSKLFFEFVRLINECKPHLFFLENVKMEYKHELVISKYLGVNPIEINSSLLSAQNRVRLYWTNINEKPMGLFGAMYPDIKQPKDKGIFLEDILETYVDEKFFISEKQLRRLNLGNLKIGGQISFETAGKENNKATAVLARDYKGISGKQGYNVIVAQRGRNIVGGKRKDIKGSPTEQRLEANTNNKSNCITSVSKDNLILQINPSKESGGKQPFQQNRIYDAKGKSPALMAELSTGSNLIQVGSLYDNNSDAGRIYSAEGKARTLKGNAGGGGAKMGLYQIRLGKSADFEQSKVDNKSYTLITTNDIGIAFNNTIRRLTPIEVERLQTIPDNYTSCVSDTQRYRVCGNGWTIDVIAHFFKEIYIPF